MLLKNLKLNPVNISKLGSTGQLEAIGTAIGRKQTEDGRWTREPANYIVECSAFHGDVLKIKLPLSVHEDFQKLVELLKTEDTVKLQFTNLEIKPYAMRTASGTFLSGVSAKAESFQISDEIEIEE